MPFVLSAENCYGQQFKFIEREGKILYKPVGKILKGTLALQQYNDRDDLRITFVDTVNLISGVGNLLKAFVASSIFDNSFKAIGRFKNFFKNSVINEVYGNPLCSFDFDSTELNTGEKKIVFYRVLVFPLVHALRCYDFNKHKGVVYTFSDIDSAFIWAKRLNISEMIIESLDGDILSQEPI